MIRKWDEPEFYSSKKDWQRLLEDSDSNPLFLSWSWMSEWWTCWGKNTSHELSIFAAYEQDELVGIAPLYLCCDSYFKGILLTNRLQFIGSRYRGRSGTRAEYLEFIANNHSKEEIVDSLFCHIFKDNSWDELILSDIVVNDSTYSALKNYNRSSKSYSRVEGSEVSYAIDCTGTFERYLKGLGKNTRLKLYNRRKLLEKLGDVTVEHIPLEDIDELYEVMNAFHWQRFSAAAFKRRDKEILRRVISDLDTDGGVGRSSILKVNGKPFSAIFNLFARNKIYNIQLGFLESFDKKISLGTLHLGYVIEEIFQDRRLRSFNLLAGPGKHTNFKESIAKPHATLETIQIVRKSLLKMLYFIKDRINH